MVRDIKIAAFKDLDKILQDKLVEKAENVLAHQHDNEDIDEAIINGLDDD